MSIGCIIQDPVMLPTSNQSINRDPRRRPQSIVPPTVFPSPVTAIPVFQTSISVPLNYFPGEFDRPRDPRTAARSSSSTGTHNNLLYVNSNNSPSISVDDAFKRYVASIDLAILDEEIRKRFRRITLLDGELDKLRRMNVELAKGDERRARRRTSSKDKDPLLKENESLQAELATYIEKLKTTMMITYPIMFSNLNTFERR